MFDSRLIFDPALAKLTLDDWCARIEDLGYEHGSFDRLGAAHMACFLDAGKTLLVTFDSAESIRTGQPGAAPRGFNFAQREGWSSLSLISKTESWFRDEAVYRYFDRLTDDGFFEDFDQILFHGTYACGYAAAAFSVAAPGARVLALSPQATLNPRIAGWDFRFMKHRRTNFTDRYGYAPDMLEAAMKAYIVHSPIFRMDAMHAALFRAPNTEMLRVNGLGWKLDKAFDALDIHDGLITEAMDGSLASVSFARMISARKQFPPYQRSLFKRAVDANHPDMAAALCRNLIDEDQTGFFSEQLEQLTASGVLSDHKQAVSAAE